MIARDLIRFDTTNYGEGRAKGEREAAEYVAREARGAGPRAAATSSPQPAPHERRRAGAAGATPTSPRSWCTATSTSCRPTPRNWSVDPFAGEIRDGMLWGRGAVDMKDMDAMILAALARPSCGRARGRRATS